MYVYSVYIQWIYSTENIYSIFFNLLQFTAILCKFETVEKHLSCLAAHWVRSAAGWRSRLSSGQSRRSPSSEGGKQRCRICTYFARLWQIELHCFSWNVSPPINVTLPLSYKRFSPLYKKSDGLNLMRIFAGERGPLSSRIKSRPHFCLQSRFYRASRDETTRRHIGYVTR